MIDRRWLGGVAVLMSLCWLTGCASIHNDLQVDLHYSTPAGQKTPLDELKPLTIALQVDDQREASVRDRVGNKINSFGQVLARIQSTSDVSDVLRQALKNEFEKSGHKVIEPSTSATAVNVRVVLKQYWIEARLHFWDVEIVATIDADVYVGGSTDGTAPPPRTLTATSRETGNSGEQEDYQHALKAALREFLREFALDTQITGALQRQASP